MLSSETYKAEDFLAAAERQGIELTVGTDLPEPISSLSPDRLLSLDLGDLEGSVESIREFHAEHPINAVVAAEDEGAILASRASKALGLPSNPEESVASARDKHVFREILAAAGLPSPWYRRYPLTADPALAAGEAPYPCVLKPLFLSAGRGVIRADDTAQFTEAFRRIAVLLAEPEIRALGGASADWLLVEGFIPGAEVAVEGILRGGEFRLLAFLDKPDPLDGPFFEETLFITPSRHPPEVVKRAVATVGRACRALGLLTGPIHAELRISGDETVPVELAPRGIGGHCSRILRFGAGLALEELILLQALGGGEEGVEREREAAGVMMIPIPSAGRLISVDGLAAARELPAIKGVEISILTGQELVPLPEGHRYLGFIYAKGGSPEEVEEALRKAHGLLEFRIQP